MTIGNLFRQMNKYVKRLGGEPLKKIAVVVLAVFSLGACTVKSSRESDGSSVSDKNQQSADKTSNSKTDKQSQAIVTAILVDDAKENETGDHSTRFVLNKVEAIEDPEKMVDMMKKDGVILNVSKKQLADGITV